MSDEKATNREAYGTDDVRVYCLRHPHEPMSYDPATGFECIKDDSVVAVYGPSSNVADFFDAIVDALFDDCRTVVQGRGGDEHCDHGIVEHGENGCAGTWYHSRCGGEHDCKCKSTRADLLAIVKGRVLTERRTGTLGMKRRLLWRAERWSESWGGSSWHIVTPLFALIVQNLACDYFNGGVVTGWEFHWRLNPRWRTDLNSTLFLRSVSQLRRSTFLDLENGVAT